MSSKIIEAAERVLTFCDAWRGSRGRHPEIVYEISPGTARGAILITADLEALALAVAPTDERFNIAAQRFHEAAGLNISHLDKPAIVAGLRAAFEDLMSAGGVK